ncbi:MAG: alginate lyase family protein [Clostridia bacterium]|nr:alginate lyase family protein [Clostridia bacterium]
MRLSDKDFYEKVIDLSIPELKIASEYFAAGDNVGAEKAFADYLKTVVPDERIDNFPKAGIEGTGGISEEEYAEEVLRGYVFSVGFKYQFPDGIIDWTYNPTFNKYVEFSFHLQYHSELVVLARAYRRTGDERFAKRFDYMLNSWIEQAECPENESGFGGKPLWRSIEAGSRMAGKWPTAINAFINSPSIPDRTWVNMFKSIWEHGYRLTKNNTQTTHNKWVINEMVGLATMGVCYPFMIDSENWLNTAVRIMIEEINTQIQPDGMQVELTTGYHGGIISNYLRVRNALQLYGKEVPADFMDGVRLMYSMYVRLAKPNLRTPGLNDGTEADVVAALTTAYKHFPDDQVFRYFSTRRAEGTPPDFLSLPFEQSGFAVMRTDWTENAIWAMLDAGPEGLAHVHEDKLAFQLYAYGTDMLADTGTYAYDTSDMRKYAVGTRSHSTGLVDGKCQNRMKTHKWGYIPDRGVKADFSYAFGEELEIAEGYYNQGYGDDLTQVKHIRKVMFFKRGLGELPPFFLLLDRFESEDGNSHDFEVSYQLPHIPVSAFEHKVTAQYANGAVMKMVSDKYPKIQIGQYAPVFVGWKPIHSPKEHEHSPAPVVSYTKRGKEADFATLLVPWKDGNAPDSLVYLTDGGFEITVGMEKYAFKYDDERFAVRSNLEVK